MHACAQLFLPSMFVVLSVPRVVFFFFSLPVSLLSIALLIYKIINWISSSWKKPRRKRRKENIYRSMCFFSLVFTEKFNIHLFYRFWKHYQAAIPLLTCQTLNGSWRRKEKERIVFLFLAFLDLFDYCCYNYLLDSFFFAFCVYYTKISTPIDYHVLDPVRQSRNGSNSVW